MVEEQRDDLLADLLAPIPRHGVVPAVEAALGIPRKQADAIVQAFDDYVARPLEANLKRLRGRDLARRNPFIYTVRGIETVDDWAEHVLLTRRRRPSKDTSVASSRRSLELSAAVSSLETASTSSSTMTLVQYISSRFRRRRTRRTPDRVAPTLRR